MKLVVDPAPAPLGPAAALFPPDGEFARALAGIARDAPRLARIPDRVVLALYACELLERLRERAADASARGLVLHAPFWPELLFEAADERVHPAREVVRLFPAPLAVVFVDRDDATLRDAALRVLAGPRFDPELYRQRAPAFAATLGWEVVMP